MALLVVGVIAAALATVPASAHMATVRSIPGQGSVVRGVDPGQAGCPNFAWPATNATTENPCALWVVFTQPIEPTGSSLAVYDSNNAPVAGTVSYRDSMSNSTAANAVLTVIPGPDTVVFTPAAALADGVYTMVATAKDIELLGGHDADCVGPPTANCVSFSFTVASSAATPVITSPADGSTVGSRLLDVSGTAEPNSAIEILSDGTVVAEGQTGTDGLFTVEGVAVPAGASTLAARATSVQTTTSERKWAAYQACEDEVLVDSELECDVAPATAEPPVSTSADITITATVVDDAEAPFIEMHTGPDSIQFLDSPIIEGFATDNDAIAAINVSVTGLLGDPIEGVTVEFENAAYTHWTIHFHEIGYYRVTITAEDAAGNTSDAISTTYLATTGDLLE